MWIQDYCTKCDKQCLFGNVYCSDSCRLEDEQAQQYSISSQNFGSPSPAASINLASEASPVNLKKGLGTSTKKHSRKATTTTITITAAAAGSLSRIKGMSYLSNNAQTTSLGPAAVSTSCSAPQQSGSGYLSSNSIQDFRFMYQSPMLRPANATASSPPVSPLLTAEADQDQIPSLSSSAYVSWLRR